MCPHSHSFTIESGLIGQAAQLNFTAPTTTPCLTPSTTPTLGTAGTACQNPNNFFWWDGKHPTARVHQMLGQTYAQQFATTAFASQNIAAAGRKMLRA